MLDGIKSIHRKVTTLRKDVQNKLSLTEVTINYLPWQSAIITPKSFTAYLITEWMASEKIQWLRGSPKAAREDSQVITWARKPMTFEVLLRYLRPSFPSS